MLFRSREREGDVPRIAAHFLRLFAGRYGKPALTLAPDALRVLAEHAWPGNVRELRNVLEQAVIVSEGEVLGPADLELRAVAPASGVPGDEAITPLEQAERDLLARALKESGANVSKAARILGVSRDTLRYRIRKHGLALAH